MTAIDSTPRLTLKGKVRAILALGTVVGIGTVLTLAAWTDTAETNATFSTGSVDIKLDGADNPPSITNLSLSNAKPGDVTYAPLTVTNEGTLDFTYVMTPSISVVSTSTPLLESVLQVSVVKVASAGACVAAAFTAPAVGDQVIYPARALNVTTATAARPLVATTGSEVLCFRVELPSSAVSAVQSQTTTATLTFVATQS